MPITANQFERRLQANDLPTVALIASSDPLLRLEATDAFRHAARRKGFIERDVFDIDGAQFDWSHVQESTMAMSLFTQQRLIELRLPTGRPGKEGGEFIQSFCHQPPRDLLLLIVAEDWSKKHETAWVTAVDQSGWFLTLWPLKSNEMPGWLERRLNSHGLQATPDALRLLIERVEGNLLAAAQEVDKLALLKLEGRIDVIRMEALVADSARFDIFTLTDSALAGDAPRALRMLASLKAEGEAIQSLIIWPANQLQLLLGFAELAACGKDVNQAMQQARIWDNKQTLYKRALGRLNLALCEALVVQCAKIERIGKGRQSGNAWLEMERLLVTLATGRSAQTLLSVS